MRIPLLLTTVLMSMAPIGLTQDAPQPQPQNIFAVKCTDIRTQFVQGTRALKTDEETYAAMICPLSKPVGGVNRIVIFFHHDDSEVAPRIDIPNKRFVIVSTFDRFAAYSICLGNSNSNSNSDSIHGQWTTNNDGVTSITFQQADSGRETPLEFEPNPRGLTPAHISAPDHTPPRRPGLMSSGPITK